VQQDVVPPTTNLLHPDPACDLDVVRDVARPTRVRAAITNAFAFGGQNSCVAVRKWGGGA
jgi:3-oxoacyl-(acyl-carrier-protein) synthase